MRSALIFLSPVVVFFVVTAWWRSAEIEVVPAEPGAPRDDLVLPIFVMAAKDIENGNGIESIFVERAGGDAEITVVFFDEDCPQGLDRAYDFIRQRKFGRLQDVETFFYHHVQQDGTAVEIVFDGTYAGEQSFEAPFPSHESSRVSFSAFEHREGRPVIYVTTWNHMFSEKNLSGTGNTVVDTYTVRSGDRERVEALLRQPERGRDP